MASKPIPNDLPVHYFPSASEFEDFLEREHKTAPGIYLKLAKKAAGVPTVSGTEAVEVALCFGWIDGRANGIDDKWWTVRYTPRRSKSIWSQKNVNTIAKLIADNRMRPAGLAAVEAAKADGRWERAYAGPATMTVPPDLTVALAASPGAAAKVEEMNRSERYALLWRIETASPANRAKRIETLVQMLEEGKSPREPQKYPKKRKLESETKSVPVPAAENKTKKKNSPKQTQPPQDGQKEVQHRREGLRPR